MAKAAISFEKRDESAQMSLVVYYFEREYSNNEKNTLKMLCFFKIFFFCSFFFLLLHQNMILFSSPGELLQILEYLSEIDLKNGKI